MTFNEIFAGIISVIGLLLAIAVAPRERIAVFWKWMGNLFLIALLVNSGYQAGKFFYAEGAPSRLEIGEFVAYSIYFMLGLLVLSWDLLMNKRSNEEAP